VCRNTAYRPAAFAECHAIANDRRSRAVATGGTLYPDHVVFLGPGARAVDGDETMDVVARDSPPPTFLLIAGAGTVLRTDLPSGAEPLLRCLGLVAARLPPGVDVVYLSADEELALANWDAEHYRKSVGSAPRVRSV
jgi:rhamnose utilization protein RhaD (predicted bifunctional aldolase and dehydrogenase)